MKPDDLFKRNHLAGAAGDAINAVLALAGHNLRLLLAWLRLHCAWILAALRSHLRRRAVRVTAAVPPTASQHAIE
jgi:IS5 family transposase